MRTELFDYSLPDRRIAQFSIEPRDAAKLLILDRKTGKIHDRRVYDLPSLFNPDDLLVFNDSRVFKARLHACKTREILLLRPQGNTWLTLIKGLKDLRVGDELAFAGETTVILREKYFDGTALLDFGLSADKVFALANRIGEVPVPPYVKANPQNMKGYQTIYAKHVGSVAAPTAGFHFTQRLLDELENKGIKRAFVTLHVGLGTFRPMKSATLEEHVMHAEWAKIPSETLKMIHETKRAGRRVIVVGTTAMRALESQNFDIEKDLSGFTDLFIKPGFEFKIADGLITNFHLPKSTLLVLVSAFAGRGAVLNAYHHAIDNDYRFYSFGDAMLII